MHTRLTIKQPASSTPTISHPVDCFGKTNNLVEYKVVFTEPLLLVEGIDEERGKNVILEIHSEIPLEENELKRAMWRGREAKHTKPNPCILQKSSKE